MITYILLGIIVFLIIYIIIKEIIHHFERKDLYTRIMCRNIGEYKTANDEVHEHVKPKASRMLEEWRKTE